MSVLCTVLWLWWLAPSYSPLVLRSGRHTYVRPNCWYDPCLPARPLCLHKGVLKGICRYNFRSVYYVFSKIHTSKSFNLSYIFGRHYRCPPQANVESYFVHTDTHSRQTDTQGNYCNPSRMRRGLITDSIDVAYL